MTLLPEYAAELTRAGDRLARRRVVLRRRVRTMTMLVVGLLAVGAMTAGAATRWMPQLGDDRRGRPSASESEPSVEQLALIGALRREATEADHGEEVRYALSMLSPGVGAIRTEHVRLLGTYGDGLGVVLVPVVTKNKRDKLCLSMRDAEDGTGVGCYTTDDVLAGHAFIGMIAAARPDPEERQAALKQLAKARKEARKTGQTAIRIPDAFSRTTGPMTVVGLVPDDVARVKWDDAEAVVKNNFFTLVGPDGDEMPRLEWFDNDGKLVAPRG